MPDAEPRRGKLEKGGGQNSEAFEEQKCLEYLYVFVYIDHLQVLG